MLALRGGKEAREFVRAVDPDILADGISDVERDRMRREGAEAREAISRFLECL
mgnify:CR=1 FL=1